jgi:hypothetical protein
VHNANQAITCAESTHNPVTHGAGAHRIDKLRRYGEGNVSVKERTADFSEASLEVCLTNATLSTESLQRRAKATSERIKHEQECTLHA